MISQDEVCLSVTGGKPMTLAFGYYDPQFTHFENGAANLNRPNAQTGIDFAFNFTETAAG
jgi:hypothetical protein